jgi:hypothetical protein
MRIVEAEAAKTQMWNKFRVKCGYLEVDTDGDLYETYNLSPESLVNMIKKSENWLIQFSFLQVSPLLSFRDHTLTQYQDIWPFPLPVGGF